MNFDKEKEQLFLKLAFNIRRNRSPAINTARTYLDELLEETIYRWYCEKEKNYVYSLNSREQYQLLEVKKPKPMFSKGRPKTSDEIIESIRDLHSKGHSIRVIAASLKVGRGTVEKYIK